MNIYRRDDKKYFKLQLNRIQRKSRHVLHVG